MPFAWPFDRTPTPTVAGEPDDLDDASIRRRLAELPAERQRLAEQHRRNTQPLVQRRDQLQAELSRIDNDLEAKGIHYGDAIRELDREQQRLQALLPAGEPEADMEDGLNAADTKAVQKLVQRLRDDPEARARLVPSTAVQIAAADQFDVETAEWATWRAHAVQARSATGETDRSLVPSFASHYPAERRRELSGGLL